MFYAECDNKQIPSTLWDVLFSVQANSYFILNISVLVSFSWFILGRITVFRECVDSMCKQ